jgi:N4-(beta-N-acetylglucosaminyl)-L-asparaginase
MNRRQLLKTVALGSAYMALPKRGFSFTNNDDKSIVLSTWYNQGVAANNAAWNVLGNKGTALDAVVQGVMVSENDKHNCCVGLGANPDREGIVTLDASIMNHKSECGSVAFLEQIANPILVARMVMENTPHVMLVGEGAQQFAVANGFPLMGKALSDAAEKTYKNWLKKSEYKPIINIERNEKGHGPNPPLFLENGDYNHDTIGMIAMDSLGNLSGACTTSGMGFKMRGRVGDSPIIGAGLYVDNEIGAATSTGNGEEVIRVSGSFLVVEFMRQGYSPYVACKKAVERVVAKTPRKLEEIQVGFIAINKDGEYGGYSLNKNFDYAVKAVEIDNLKEEAESIITN